MDVIIKDAIDNLMAQAEYNWGGINTLLNRGAVKSVQRGSGQLSKSSNITNMTISISAVNLEKVL